MILGILLDFLMNEGVMKQHQSRKKKWSVCKRLVYSQKATVIDAMNLLVEIWVTKGDKDDIYLSIAGIQIYCIKSNFFNFTFKC